MADEEQQEDRTQKQSWPVEEEDLSGFSDSEELPETFQSPQGEPEVVSNEPAPEQPERQVEPVPESPMKPRQKWKNVGEKAWARSAARKARLGLPIPPHPDTPQPTDVAPPSQPSPLSVAPEEVGIESRTETGWEPRPERVPMPTGPVTPPEPSMPESTPESSPQPIVQEDASQRGQSAPSAGEGGPPPPPATATPPPVPGPLDTRREFQTLPYDPKTQKPRAQTLPLPNNPTPPPEAAQYPELQNVPSWQNLPLRTPKKVDEPPQRSAEPQFETVPNEDTYLFDKPPATNESDGPDYSQPYFEMPAEDFGRIEPPPKSRPVMGERTRENKVGVAPIGFQNEETGEMEPMQGPAEPAPKAQAAPAGPNWYGDQSLGETPSVQMPSQPPPGNFQYQDFNPFGDQSPGEQTDAFGASGGGDDKIGQLADKVDQIVEMMGQVVDAANGMKEAITSLGNKLDNVGTYA